MRRSSALGRPAARRVSAVDAVRLASTAVALARIGQGAFREPPLSGPTGGDTSGDTVPASPSVSVIIPARDEQDRLGPCLTALFADRAASDVTVVDDESTDRTAEVARAGGARVVDAGPRPEGWAGKTWALQQGLRAATGDWVVALDADTRVRPGLVAAAVSEAERSQADLLTVGGRFDCSAAGERWLHPSMLCTLVYRFGPPGTRRPPRPERTLANGQCMVLPREAFLAAGGFTPVSASLTEDVALARLIARRHGTVRFVDGTGLLDVAGYGSAAAVWQGWGRSLALADVTSPPRQAADLVVLWATMAAPLPRLLTGRADLLDVVLLLARAGTLVALSGTYRRRGLAWWLSPLADPLVIAKLTATSARPVRTWRGRTYAPAPRSGRPAADADRPRMPWRTAAR